MSEGDRDPLHQLRDAVRSAELDVSALVDEAWADARAQVRHALTELMVDDLLRRTRSHLVPTLTDGVSPEASAAPGERVVYLLGLRRGGDAQPVVDLRLPGGGPVRWLDRGEVAAVVCDVDRSLVERLQDPAPEALDVLAATARTHDEILARLGRSGPVLPLRLGTVAASDGEIADLLDSRADELQEELVRFADVAEHAVIVHHDAGPPGPPEAVPGEGDPASGRAYLEGRRGSLAARHARSGQRQAVAQAIHDRLRAVAQEADIVTTRPLADGAPPLLHGVYLVGHQDRPAFDRAVAEVRADHPEAVVEATGPWPPYHFTHVDLGAGGAA